MTLAEALANIRAERARAGRSATADVQIRKLLLNEFFQILNDAPEVVRGDFEFELTGDNRISIYRLDAELMQSIAGSSDAPVRGPLHLGSWRAEKVGLAFFYWGNDLRSYIATDVSEALLATADIMEQQRSTEQSLPEVEDLESAVVAADAIVPMNH